MNNFKIMSKSRNSTKTNLSNAMTIYRTCAFPGTTKSTSHRDSAEILLSFYQPKQNKLDRNNHSIHLKLAEANSRDIREQINKSNQMNLTSFNRMTSFRKSMQNRDEEKKAISNKYVANKRSHSKKNSFTFNSVNQQQNAFSKTMLNKQKFNYSFDSADPTRKKDNQIADLLEKGRNLLNTKNYLQAIKMFNIVLRIKPNCRDAKFYKAIALMDSGSTDNSIDVFLLRSSLHY